MKSSLHQIALDHLAVLDGNPKPEWSGDLFSNDLGGRIYALGFDLDGGNAFCAFYGHPAFIDAEEFEASTAANGDDLNALCSGILSRWRYYSQADYCIPEDDVYEWFKATLTHLAELTRGDAPLGRSSSKNGIEVREFDVVRLVDGRVAVIVDLTKPGVAYLAEIPVTDEDSDELHDDFFVIHDEIAEVLPGNHPMPNPYVHKEWWLELMMDEYRDAFGEQFPRMLCRGMKTASVVAAIEECLNAGKPYEPDIEPGCNY